MEAKKLARRIGGIVIRLLGFVVALPVVYLVAALILGLVPANVGWQEPERGVDIFVRTNGVHTWIVVPKINAIMDWRPYAPAEHLEDPRYGNADHVAFGYGNREFYLNTPTWGDLSPRTAALALFGSGPTLLHVEHDHQPRPDQDTRPLTITPDQYRRLAAYIRARFQLDGNGETMPLIGRGYNRWDVFYEAQGGYSFVMTCNEWTGRALRHAGIRTGLWTPLSQNIMWRLD
jgi:uncharacterized protein (TIGR02117 family)